MNPLVELRSVDVVLGGQMVLRDINLNLAAGESTAIAGPNGSGKTTLLRLVATLLRPDGGEGSVLGNDIGHANIRDVRREIGMISHIPALLDELTIEENLVHFAIIAGEDPDECIRSLRIVGLERVGDRRASNSSFGMKRRAEIAWLLVSKPRLLLLDEAKSGLDSEARQLIDALTELTVERGGSAVVVSHEAPATGRGYDSAYELVGGQLRSLR